MAKGKTPPPKQPAKASTEKAASPSVSYRTDPFARRIYFGNNQRAGVPDFHGELCERLKDVQDRPEAVVYSLTVELSPAAYEALLLESIETAENLPDWTESDQLESMIKKTESYALTAKAKKA